MIPICNDCNQSTTEVKSSFAVLKDKSQYNQCQETAFGVKHFRSRFTLEISISK